VAPVLGAAVREGPGCAGVGREDGMDLCVTAAAQPLQRRGHRGSRWDGGRGPAAGTSRSPRGRIACASTSGAHSAATGALVGLAAPPSRPPTPRRF